MSETRDHTLENEKVLYLPGLALRSKVLLRSARHGAPSGNPQDYRLTGERTLV